MADEETLIVWEDRYCTWIPLIDDQHKELVRLTNALYAACLQGKEIARDNFRLVIRELVDYVAFHFSAEEKIMEKVKFPQYPDHKKQHEAFVRKVLADVQNFDEGKNFVPNTFVRYLKEWILTHIAVSDRMYSDYIMELKKNGALEL
jgi:hemerythrin